MALSPQDIVRREFREALRGYNQADVDLFLDEVVEELARLLDENQKMKVRLAALQQEVARLREGRGGGSAPSAPSAPVTQGEHVQVEAEVRARVRRFLEEQIRQIDTSASSVSSSAPIAAAPPAASPTAERMARELSVSPPPAQSGDDAPDTSGGQQQREPFWAGE